MTSVPGRQSTPVSLSPEQHDELSRLLVDELRTAWGAAVARGVTPEALAEAVEERRLAVESARVVSALDDAQGRGGDPVQ